MCRSVLMCCLLLGLAGGWAAGKVRGQDPPAAKTVRIVLQQESPHVTHQLEAAGYRVHVEFRADLTKTVELVLELVSFEAGRWEHPETRYGRLIEAHLPPQQAQQKTLQAGQILQMTFRRDPRFDPGLAEKRFKKELDELTASARREIAAKPSRLKEEVRLTTAVRQRIGLRLMEYQKRHTKDLYPVLGPPFFLRSPKPTEETLEQLHQWIALDRVLGAVGLPRRSDAKDEEILGIAKDVGAVLRGEKTERAQCQFLRDREIEVLKAALAIHCRADVTPVGAEGEPDHNWSIAHRVGLASGMVGAVEWRGTAGPRGRPSQWLAVEGAGPLKVEPLGSAEAYAWAVVAGGQTERYVRVVPRNPQTSADFALRVGGAAGGGATVPVTSPPATRVTFPF